jgi:cytochrome b561
LIRSVIGTPRADLTLFLLRRSANLETARARRSARFRLSSAPQMDTAVQRSPEPASAYDGVSIVLHWLLALLIVGSFFVGLYMSDLAFSPLRFRLFNWHKWIGMAVLALSAARLLWRLLDRRAPALPAGMPRWQIAVFKTTHVAFYALFFAVPLLGWFYTSAVGVPVVWFGVLPLPDLVPLDKAFGDQVWKPLHEAASYLLAALVVLHVAAALKHQFVDRDHLLARMWPRRPGGIQ